MQTRRMIAQGSQSSVSRRWKKWISMLLPTGGNMMTLMYRAGGGQDPLHKHVRYKEHILWLFEYFGSLEKK